MQRCIVSALPFSVAETMNTEDITVSRPQMQMQLYTRDEFTVSMDALYFIAL